MSVNKVILVGNLGKAPELKYIPGTNVAVCNFTVATSETWNDKQTGQKQERTEWHNISVNGKIAENCNKYLTKGSKVYIEGAIHTRSWDDKATGQKRYMTEIRAQSVQFLSAKGTGGGAPSYENESAQSSSGAPGPMNYDLAPDSSFTADDIPF